MAQGVSRKDLAKASHLQGQDMKAYALMARYAYIWLQKASRGHLELLPLSLLVNVQ